MYESCVYESSPAKLRAKTPSRYDLEYDNVSNLRFEHKCNFLYLCTCVREKERERERDRQRINMYVCESECDSDKESDKKKKEATKKM